MGEEGQGLGGRFGKVRKLFDDKVVAKLKDSETRDNVMHQVSDHADTLKDAGMAMASRFMGGGGDGGEKRAEGEAGDEERVAAEGERADEVVDEEKATDEER